MMVFEHMIVVKHSKRLLLLGISPNLLGLSSVCFWPSKDMVARIFVHGPGGSGKTFMLNEIILPVYEEYLPGMSKGVAAQNSAARLIGGSTFHHMAGLGRKQDLLLKKPSRDRREALRRKWRRVALLFIDEISLTSPNLLAMLHASACWGRLDDVQPGDFLDHIFGDVLLQMIAGDFLQLNPVLSHSLMGSFGITVPGAPTYEQMDSLQREKKQELDTHGYQVFKAFLKHTVLFRGSHRFKKGDPLAALLGKMRKVGGEPLGEALKEAIARQVYRPLAGDDRLSSDYCMYDDSGKQIGPTGFFSRGAFSAVNWDQVARLQQLCAYESAKASYGCAALYNSKSGKPRLLLRAFPLYVSKKVFNRDKNNDFVKMLDVLETKLMDFLQVNGQLLFYVQAVDLIHQQEFVNDKTILKEALAISNMSSKTANLISFLPLHQGMRCKITKKILPPELVQEAPVEILSIEVHPQERYGIPGHPPGLPLPDATHPCWATGHVRLDYVPAAIAVRVEVGLKMTKKMLCWFVFETAFRSHRVNGMNHIIMNECNIFVWYQE